MAGRGFSLFRPLPARAGWLLAALAGAAGPALAEADCGAPVAGVVVCDGAGNPYPAGIVYDVAGDLTLTLTNQAVVAGPVSVKADHLMMANDARIETSSASAAALALSAAGGVELRSNGAIVSRGEQSAAVLITSAGRVLASASQILTSGKRSDGVVVSGGEAVDLQLSEVEVRGVLARAVGVDATGDVRIRADRLATTGDDGQALVVSGRAIDIAVKTVDVANGLRRAIDIEASGPVRLALGSVRFTGGGLDAVFVHAADGDVTVTADRVETGGDQSRAIGVGAPHAVASAVVGTIVTTGDDAMGLYVAGADAKAVVTGLVSTEGRRRLLTTADGVQVHALGRTSTDGHATAVVSSIHAAGLDARALLVDASRLASVQILGEVLAPQGEALHLTAADAEVSIASSAMVSGRVGVAAQVTGTTRLVNEGTIAGPDAIIATGSGAGVYENRGLLRGRVSLGGGGDTIVNSGLAVIDGDWDLGAGLDQIFNTGAVRLATTGVETRIAAVEGFDNSGLIDLTGAGGRRRLRIDGAYVGRAGGRLAVDLSADGGDGIADQLRIVGLAAGRTEVTVKHLQGVLGLLGQAPIVKVGVGSASDAFVLAPVAPRGEFIEEQLIFDPQASQFALRGLPSVKPLQIIAAVAADELIWLENVRGFWARRAGGSATAVDGWSGWLEGERLVSDARSRVGYEAFGADVSRSVDLDDPEDRLSGGVERLSQGQVTRRLAVTGTVSWRERGDGGPEREGPGAWSVGLEIGRSSKAAFMDLAVGVRAGRIRTPSPEPIFQGRRVLPTAQAIAGRYVDARAVTLVPWVGAALSSTPHVKATAADGVLVTDARTLATAGVGLRIERRGSGDFRPFVEFSALRRLTPRLAATLSDGTARLDLTGRLEDSGLAVRSGVVWRPTPRVVLSLEGALGETGPRALSASVALRF